MTKSSETHGNGSPGTREIADRAKDLAADAGKEILDRANREGQRGFNALGERLDQAAEYIGSHAKSDAVPVEKVTDGLHSAARYLKETDPRSMAGEVDRVIRAHPYRAMAVGVGVGWLIGRLMRPD